MSRATRRKILYGTVCFSATIYVVGIVFWETAVPIMLRIALVVTAVAAHCLGAFLIWATARGINDRDRPPPVNRPATTPDAPPESN